MKQWKSPLLALAAAALLSGQTHAAEQPLPEHSAVLAPQTVAVLNTADIQSIFESTGQPMQLVALSAQEMKETEGAYYQITIPVGIINGGFSYYVGNRIAQDEWSWVDFSVSALRGGVEGALLTPTGLVWTVNAELSIAMIQGLMNRFF